MHEQDKRLLPRRWFDDALDRQPRTCPACGSDEIVPTFPGPAWQCGALDCGYVWEPSTAEG